MKFNRPALVNTILSVVLLSFFFSFLFSYNLHGASEPKIGPMPAAVSDNAVATSYAGEVGQKVFSFMGIGPKKTWDAVTASAYELDVRSGKWAEKRPVPGVAGRVAGPGG